MAENQAERQSSITIDNRKKLTISGVCDVVGFDEQNIDVTTSLGKLSVEGNGMRILNLDTDNGIMTVDGSIDAIFYRDNQTTAKVGFLSRLLK